MRKPPVGGFLYAMFRSSSFTFPPDTPKKCGEQEKQGDSGQGSAEVDQDVGDGAGAAGEDLDEFVRYRDGEGEEQAHGDVIPSVDCADTLGQHGKGKSEDGKFGEVGGFADQLMKIRLRDPVVGIDDRFYHFRNVAAPSVGVIGALDGV